MSAGGFPGALGVVVVRLAHADPVATLPLPSAEARSAATALTRDLYNLGGSWSLLQFDRRDGQPCWIRARDVVAVEIVSTEDPGA